MLGPRVFNIRLCVCNLMKNLQFGFKKVVPSALYFFDFPRTLSQTDLSRGDPLHPLSLGQRGGLPQL
jgi:hypothetical protein